MADAPYPHSFSSEQSPSAACGPRLLSPGGSAVCLQLGLGLPSLLWPLLILFISDARPLLCGEVMSDPQQPWEGQEPEP